METMKKLSKVKNLTGGCSVGQLTTATLFGCQPEQVATSVDELENCQYFYGDLILNNLSNADNIYNNKLKAINGNLIVMNCNLDVISNLKFVTGFVQLISSKIKYVNDIFAVGGNLSMINSEIIAMPKLKCVGGSLLMQNSDILNFNELENIKSNVYLSNSYVGCAKKMMAISGDAIIENSKVDILPNHQIFCPSIKVFDEKRNITHKYSKFYNPDIEKNK